MDAAHFAQTFWTCHVDTVIDVGGVSALSQITFVSQICYQGVT